MRASSSLPTRTRGPDGWGIGGSGQHCRKRSLSPRRSMSARTSPSARPFGISCITRLSTCSAVVLATHTDADSAASVAKLLAAVAAAKRVATCEACGAMEYVHAHGDASFVAFAVTGFEG